MKVAGSVALVTGAASGLGLACARRFAREGAQVFMVDLAEAPLRAAAAGVGVQATAMTADVTDEAAMQAVFNAARAAGPVRALVHCAGRVGSARMLDRSGQPASLAHFEAMVRVNLVGTFNVLRLAAACMKDNPPLDGERGACVLTASIAAYEGQVGQAAYAASKAGVVGLTLVAARDLAPQLIRVCSIAPGIFDTPMLGSLPDPVRAALADNVPHPGRLGHPDEFAALAVHIVENAMLNGETIRLDAALRMAPR